MKSAIIIAFLFFSIQAISLAGGIKGDISPFFALSPDGNRMAITVSQGETSHVYEYNFIDKTLIQLTETKNQYHTNPVYSSKGDTILFLSKTSNNTKSDIHLIDLKTRTISKITNGETYITEAIFNSTGNKIIYCGAGYFGNYSPMSRPAPHDLDLYSININGTEKNKITKLTAYDLSSISLSQTGDSILCRITEKEYEGIYLISITDTTFKQKITAKNNPRPEIGDSFYNDPLFAPDYKSISFTAPYQLYIMDLQNYECREVWSTFGKDQQAMVIYNQFYKAGDKMMFSVLKIENRQYASSADLMMVDLKTNEVINIKIN